MPDEKQFPTLDERQVDEAEMRWRVNGFERAILFVLIQIRDEIRAAIERSEKAA